ncbi:hypothetical protein E3Q24_03058 [Wallemia mellicola]|uniref:Uncharacterized protein n=1 Tax=Wallemia mellicola TaxID=1708541 RepID=A0AB38MVC2_9BASI|nr:hypothetical protein E3Q24_03058 [Wallemia mellicola]TIC22489.1 hypothetical protein E3Q12_02642 [Wallemia mellicola]TIC60825.1 hypothetical protein E3Q03_02968 [Wallemia mellicola]TIC63411.1 hypothetical protein E3Q02_03019 [Wallemia mellicola]
MRYTVLLLITLYVSIFSLCLVTSEEVTKFGNTTDWNDCSDDCSLEVNDSGDSLTQAEQTSGASRMATHIYALGGWGIVAISAVAKIAKLLAPAKCIQLMIAYLRKKCAKREIKNRIPCHVTANGDVVKLTIEGSFDRLHQMGFAVGSVRFEHDSEDWSSWVDIVTKANQPIPDPVEEEDDRGTWYWFLHPVVEQ